MGLINRFNPDASRIRYSTLYIQTHQFIRALVTVPVTLVEARYSSIVSAFQASLQIVPSIMVTVHHHIHRLSSRSVLQYHRCTTSVRYWYDITLTSLLKRSPLRCLAKPANAVNQIRNLKCVAPQIRIKSGASNRLPIL
jgi:hypothetical protein